MSRLNKTSEIIELGVILQNSFCGKTLDEIAEHFECSRRSAERMKALLGDLFPNKLEEVQSSDKKKRWRFKKGTMNFLVSFTSQDFANLELLKKLITDVTKQKELSELIEKIKAINPQNNSLAIETDISAYLETEGFAVRQHPKNKINPQVLDKLREALLSFKKVKITYKKTDVAEEIILHPYGILISQKHYLVAYSEHRNAIRQYLVHKILDVKVQDEYFVRQDSFDLKEYSEKSFGIYQEEPFDVELVFDKQVLEEVLNYHFHPSQKIKQLTSGDVKVKFKACGKIAICWELFKWGNNVKILAPKELKNTYKGLIEDVKQAM